ncbi:hypothetical protein ACFL57_02215, partial [Candidatus Margulisiibacteriota bacterium]
EIALIDEIKKLKRTYGNLPINNTKFTITPELPDISPVDSNSLSLDLFEHKDILGLTIESKMLYHALRSFHHAVVTEATVRWQMVLRFLSAQGKQSEIIDFYNHKNEKGKSFAKILDKANQHGLISVLDDIINYATPINTYGKISIPFVKNTNIIKEEVLKLFDYIHLELNNSVLLLAKKIYSKIWDNIEIIETTVNIDDLLPIQWYVYRYRIDNMMKSFGKSLHYGPLLVYLNNNRLFLPDGHHRSFTAIKKGVNTNKAMVVKTKNNDPTANMIADNYQKCRDAFHITTVNNIQILDENEQSISEQKPLEETIEETASDDYYMSLIRKFHQ